MIKARQRASLPEPPRAFLKEPPGGPRLCRCDGRLQPVNPKTLLRSDDLLLQSRQDASDFANVTGSISPDNPVVPTFHNPADLAARAAARGCGLVFVPSGAVQARCLILILDQ